MTALTAREELARLLFITDNWRAKDPAAEWEAAQGAGAEYVYDMADALIRAGYVHAPTLEAVAADLQERGDNIEAKGSSGSIYATRAEGRGIGYREAARSIRAALAEPSIEKIEPAATPQDRTPSP